jgi:hypothetical protein
MIPILLYLLADTTTNSVPLLSRILPDGDEDWGVWLDVWQCDWLTGIGIIVMFVLACFVRAVTWKDRIR